MTRMASARTDWAKLVERLSGGDRAAFVELSRAITGFLAGWRAYDFRDEWDDVVQEVVLAVVEAHRARKLREPGAVIGYLRTTTRYKFVDWLRRRRLDSLDAQEEESGGEALAWPPPEDGPEGGFQIWDKVRSLPEKQQAAVVLVYVEGCTYDEAAEKSGIPLGSLKRYLREGLAGLRESLAEFVDPRGPISGAHATSSFEDAADGRSRPGGAP